MEHKQSNDIKNLEVFLPTRLSQAFVYHKTVNSFRCLLIFRMGSGSKTVCFQVVFDLTLKLSLGGRLIVWKWLSSASNGKVNVNWLHALLVVPLRLRGAHLLVTLLPVLDCNGFCS